MFPLLLAEAAVSTTEGLIGAVLAVMTPIMVKILRDWLKDDADRHMATVKGAAKLAFWLTEEAKRLWPNKVPSALLYAEAKFIELLEVQNISPTPAEMTLARATWGATHGAETVTAELANMPGKVPTVVLQNPSMGQPPLGRP